MSMRVNKIPMMITVEIIQKTYIPPLQQNGFLSFSSTEEPESPLAANNAFARAAPPKDLSFADLTGNISGVPVSPITRGRGRAIGGRSCGGIPKGAPGAAGPIMLDPAILRASAAEGGGGGPGGGSVPYIVGGGESILMSYMEAALRGGPIVAKPGCTIGGNDNGGGMGIPGGG